MLLDGGRNGISFFEKKISITTFTLKIAQTIIA